MHKRDAIHKLASIYNDPLLISKYRTLRNLVTSSIRKSKQMFFNTHLQNARGNQKLIWKMALNKNPTVATTEITF